MDFDVELNLRSRILVGLVFAVTTFVLYKSIPTLTPFYICYNIHWYMNWYMILYTITDDEHWVLYEVLDTCNTLDAKLLLLTALSYVVHEENLYEYCRD